MNITNYGYVDNYLSIYKAITMSDFQAETWRQKAKHSNHKDTETVYLRSVIDLTLDAVYNDTIAVSKPILFERPVLLDALAYLMYLTRGAELGRAMIVNLKAGGHISPHTDEGSYPRYYERYHLPLVTSEGCLFTVGDETIHMKEGYLYQIDNQQVHSVHNASDSDRIHLIVDIKLI